MTLLWLPYSKRYDRISLCVDHKDIKVEKMVLEFWSVSATQQLGEIKLCCSVMCSYKLLFSFSSHKKGKQFGRDKRDERNRQGKPRWGVVMMMMVGADDGTDRVCHVVQENDEKIWKQYQHQYLRKKSNGFVWAGVLNLSLNLTFKFVYTDL